LPNTSGKDWDKSKIWGRRGHLNLPVQLRHSLAQRLEESHQQVVPLLRWYQSLLDREWPSKPNSVAGFMTSCGLATGKLRCHVGQREKPTSPLFANVYLHYVFDLWVEAWRKKVAQGDVIVVCYADDLVAGFESRAFSRSVSRTSGEFRSGIACGKEAADRVRAVGRTKSEAAWGGEARNLHVLGFHALLREAPERRELHCLAQKRPKSGWWQSCML
jgi:hypothetical protein